MQVKDLIPNRSFFFGCTVAFHRPVVSLFVFFVCRGGRLRGSTGMDLGERFGPGDPGRPLPLGGTRRPRSAREDARRAFARELANGSSSV